MQAVLFIVVFFLSSQSLAEEMGCSAAARSLHLACGYDVREENFIRMFYRAQALMLQKLDLSK